MSLDVYLTLPTDGASIKGKQEKIYIRENGQVKTVTREEWNELYPNWEPVVLEEEEITGTVYTANITHNLAAMAKEAEIYQCLWRPEEAEITKAHQLIGPLATALEIMKRNPQRFIALNPPNGWGSYVDFVPWIESYLAACKEYPTAEVSVWR